MIFPLLLIFFLIFLHSTSSKAPNFGLPGEGSSSSTISVSRLSKPLIGNDGRIYTCSEKDFFAFESNGFIAWSLRLSFTCNSSQSPVHGGRGKIYLVAENRVLKLRFVDIRTSPPSAEIFFGQEKGHGNGGEIVGVAVSTLSSSVYINVKNRGLFAYTMRGQLVWSIGPVLSQFGYRLGCRKGIADCYFASVPVIDQCEASIYISNSAGELYSLSLRSPHFNWVQDLSSFDKGFTITPGNNGRLYVIVPTRALVLALDVFTGNVLWQTSIGPVNRPEFAPVIDSNGWISFGSLDGYMYSISPSGQLRKFTKASELDHVIQANPLLDCSGYAVYISQTKMEGKVSRIIGDYTYISAMRPQGVVFTLVAPPTGKIYWSESYPGQFLSFSSQSDLKHFALDEEILLAFVAASGIGNPLQCRSKHEKLISTCSQARTKRPSCYTGSKKTIMWFLLIESIILVVFAALVRFCCIFWSKKKLQGEDLGSFLERRRSLQLQKKSFDTTITELQKKDVEDSVAHDVIEEWGDLVREGESIEKKLSTTYSLGRDRNASLQSSKSILPVYDGKTRSYSFQSAKKESVTIFRTLSDTSSGGSSSAERESDSCCNYAQEGDMTSVPKGKGKAPLGAESLSDDDEVSGKMYMRNQSGAPSSFKVYANPVFPEKESMEDELHDEVEVVESSGSGGRSTWLKRRTLSSRT